MAGPTLFFNKPDGCSSFPSVASHSCTRLRLGVFHHQDRAGQRRADPEHHDDGADERRQRHLRIVADVDEGKNAK